MFRKLLISLIFCGTITAIALATCVTSFSVFSNCGVANPTIVLSRTQGVFEPFCTPNDPSVLVNTLNLPCAGSTESQVLFFASNTFNGAGQPLTPYTQCPLYILNQPIFALGPFSAINGIVSLPIDLTNPIYQNAGFFYLQGLVISPANCQSGGLTDYSITKLFGLFFF